MKVLIFYTHNKGPLSNFFEELSAKLIENGFEVTNFFLKNRKERFSRHNITFIGEKRRGYLSNYYHTFKVIRQVKPDVIISNFSYVNPALLFGKLLGVKRNLCWFHTVYGHARPNKLKVFNKKMHLKMADAMISNSLILKDELESIYGFQKEHIHAIPFWTNISKFENKHLDLKINRTENTVFVGCPGRLVADKNHSVVIEALKELKQRDERPVKLFIAGSGPFESELESVAERKGLKEDVIFLGLLTASEMQSFYKQMDLVVLPSLNEAFGLVFIEAIALGVPVIVSSQFGSLGYIDSEEFNMEHFIFDPRSKDELIEKLEHFMKSNDITCEFFEELYKQTFDKSVIFEKIEKVIRNTA